MATTKKATKKEAKEMTLEDRVERIEKALGFLGAKLRSHGIHLEADPEPASEPEEQDEE